MKHLLIIVVFFSALLLNGCNKAPVSEEDQILGTWVKEGTDGSGPGGTLYFSRKNGKYILQFDCSGSPGPNWPSTAETEYKFQNGKLSYIDYSDSGLGFYTAMNFNWITKGEVFEVRFREILLFMSSNGMVKYKKQN